MKLERERITWRQTSSMRKKIKNRETWKSFVIAIQLGVEIMYKRKACKVTSAHFVFLHMIASIVEAEERIEE